jgi:hypothetical protein
MVFMKKLLIWLALFLSAGTVVAQTSTITFTTTDTDGTVWANGSWKLEFVPNPSQPNINIYNYNGTPVSQITGVLLQSGSLNGSGYATFTQYNNAVINPSGSQYRLTVCPNASTGCGVFLYTVVSSTDISSIVTANIPAPRFPATAGAYGYSDIEALLTLPAGATYWNVVSASQRCYNNVTAAWGSCSTGFTGYPGVTSTGTGGLEGYSGSGSPDPAWQLTPAGEAILQSLNVTSLDQVNSAVVITAINGGSGYGPCTVNLTGGTCSTAPVFACIPAGSPPSSALIIQTKAGSCTVSPTATISGGGTGASITLALASNIASTPSGSGMVAPISMTGGTTIVGGLDPFIYASYLIDPVFASMGNAYVDCLGAPTILMTPASVIGFTLGGGCANVVNIGEGETEASFSTASMGNETLWGGNLVFDSYNNSYNVFQTMNEGFIFNITSNTSLASITEPPAGTGYTGAGTCSISGGIVLSGTLNGCTASLSSGGIVFTLTGAGCPSACTTTYSLFPILTWSGATGGTGAFAPALFGSGTPVGTGSVFMDPTRTYHINTGTIPSSSGISGPGPLTNDLFATGPGITYIGGIQLPLTVYSHAGTQLSTCVSGIVGGEAVVSDSTSLIPGTAYSPSSGSGDETVRVQCTSNGEGTYAWQTM